MASVINAMTPRRSQSTTSLSRFYHEIPDAEQSSLDFCNAFWGPNDCGVEVLFARMRGSVRTMEELRGFWKERIAIEEDYAKRLGKLSKLPLGRDEIGDLRVALDSLRVETDRLGSAHLDHAQNMKRELEHPTNEFITKQTNHKKTFQTSIEKSYKSKQTQEKYVDKAREKYETDCQHINSFTAQMTLLQGKELERIQLKLERVQQTVQGNERDYQNFARALSDTTKRWEGEWKTYCDQSQDLEDERIEFMKDNIWAYANAVSTICVADDESCEKIRVQLEQVEAERDMENFVRDYGTGDQMQQPTPFVSYKPGSGPAPPKVKTATFLRTSIRAPLMRPDPLPSVPVETEPSGPGAAGLGSASRGLTQSAGQNGATGSNHNQSSIAASVPRAQTQALPPSSATPQRPTQGPSTSRPTESTMLTIGGNTYAVDPNSDPQAARRVPGQVGDEKDPIAQALDALRKGGGVTRNGVGSIRGNTPGGSRSAIPMSTAPKDRAPSPQPRPTSVDYRGAAENIVGTHPASRPTSPMSPRAAMMQPPQPQRTPLNEVHQQAFPGERRLSINHGQPNGSAPPARTPSPGRDGFAGIGAQGRSTSPQPFQGVGSQGGYNGTPGPAQQQQQQYNQGYQQQRPPSAAAPRPASTAGFGSGQQSAGPAPIGITLDASGQVAHDSMAEEHARRSYYQQQGQPPRGPQDDFSQGYQRPRSGQGYQPNQYPQSQPPQPPQQQQGYGGGGYQSNQRPSTATPANGYGPPSASMVTIPPSSSYPAGYAPPQQSQPQQPLQQQTGAYQQNGSYFPPQQQYGLNSTAPIRRSPSPVPPPHHAHDENSQGGGGGGQLTDDGANVLFYVKALYDYVATTPEEFDFQSGDIIAVTATPDDGWWSGVLLDDTRRVTGRTVFPSNFVCLF